MGIRTTVTEQDFNKKLSTQYRLSILLGMDSFFYCVQNTRGQILVLKDFQLDTPQNPLATFNRLRQTEELLKLSYREVKIGVTGERSTLIPDRLYNRTHIKSYLHPVSPLVEQEIVQTDDLPTLSLKHVYTADNSLEEVLKQQFSYSKVYHIKTALLRALQRRQRNQSGYALYVNVSTTNLDIFLYEDQKLLFVNTFDYQSSKDFVYYILLTYDQFKLSPTELPIHLSGQIVHDSKLFRLLYRYVKTIHMMDVTDLAKVGEQYQENVPLHHYYDLISLSAY